MANGEQFVTDVEGVRGRIDATPRKGQRLVTVTLDDGRRGSLPTMLLKPTGPAEYRVPARFDELFAGRAAKEQRTIPVIEEELEVGKRTTRTRTRISKSVQEREEVVDEPHHAEEVTIERVPVNRVVEKPVATHVEGETTVIPVHEEEVVVTKRWILREEIRVTKRSVERHEKRSVVLRREEPRIERDRE